MARVPKMASGNISEARGIHCCPFFFLISFARSPSPYCAQYVHIYTHVWLRTDCISITVATKHFYSKLSCAKCSLDIYSCGAGLAQGRINLFGAPRQWKHFRPLFQAVFLSGRGGITPQTVKHHTSQSQDRNNKYFILYIEFCINNKT